MVTDEHASKCWAIQAGYQKNIVGPAWPVSSKSNQKHIINQQVNTNETRWYIRSLDLNAEQALHAVRSHWQVESMHWMLDMTFREDESRIRKGNGALAFNLMRKIALNLFKQDETKSASIARKKKMAGLNDEYRSTLLESGIKMR